MWLFLVGRGTCRARLAAAPLRRSLRRVPSLRCRSGQRRRASMALFSFSWVGEEFVFDGNIRDEPRARRQRLLAAAEACGVVLRARRHLADMDSRDGSSSDIPHIYSTCSKRSGGGYI